LRRWFLGKSGGTGKHTPSKKTHPSQKALGKGHPQEGRTKRLRAAVFLDRDGTICEEVGYLNHVERFRMFAVAGPAIRRLNEAGFAVIVTTNQSGVSRGYFPESLVQKVHEVMRRELAASGARLDGVYYCPHGSGDGCDCRKPGIGMIQRSAAEHGIDVARSFVVGDRYRDMEMAFAAGCRGIFVRTGYGRGEEAWHAKEWARRPHAIADDLGSAVDWILGNAR
jgi:D-glycero-D-manno-heptose 1,7-bisphosphate phosphatase